MNTAHRCAAALPVVALAAGAVLTAPTANADNRRLNNSVVANVYTMQHKAGCDTDIKVNPKLRLAAQWHTNDVLHNRALNGDIGSDGTTVADRARNAGYAGAVAETVAINPALAISGIELINQWFHRPDYHAIMSDCANVDIGVWSESVLDRTVVVAVYGKGDGAPPVPSDIRDFGQVPGWTP
ncbi:CAP domain-containing protein [Mycobacterium sp. AMU20-3851]|uniref:CAP domain-containing protein n=1 Tax=Mycobacterium sp. AMU20-3851 TaxID=3122055 RepID=UPI003754ECD5